jgi:hypothetical protein
VSKSSLLHRRRETRSARRRRQAPQAAPARPPAKPEAIAPARRCDPEVRRVREAGGPIDVASYVCACGYLFDAAVSTSVACPHCGEHQAW